MLKWDDAFDSSSHRNAIDFFDTAFYNKVKQILQGRVQFPTGGTVHEPMHCIG